jgi:hypothetical protein
MANRSPLANSPSFEVPDLIGDFRTALAPKQVDIIEFAESDEYCGRPLYPYQKILLKLIFLQELEGWEEDILSKWIKESSTEAYYPTVIAPMIRERIDWLRDRDYKHFPTVQMVGGRRSGKGYMTGIAIAYKAYQLILMDDPMYHYGVDPTKEIYFPIIAASLKQSKEFQFSDAFNTITNCKAMKRFISKGTETLLTVHTPADMRREIEMRAMHPNISRDMAKIKIEALATSASTIRGGTSMVITLDEMAHMMAGESSRSADLVWDSATPSLKQFDRDGMVFANSSPWTKIGKFFELYEQSLKLEGAFPKYPEIFMMQWPSWVLFEEWQKASNPMIAKRKRPLMTYEALDSERRQDPDKFRVEYGAHFQETLDAFLRPEMVDRMFSGYTPDKRLLGTTHSGTALHVYKGHGDPSQTTANFGIAIGHVEMFNEVVFDENGNPTLGPNGQPELVKMPHVVFDLIDAFYPADMEDGVIDWVNIVMPEITRLIQNFRPKEFTFDQFDSTMAIQQLRKNISQLAITDVRVREVTATAAVNKRRWDNFKAALYLGRVHAPAPFGQLNERSLALGRDELKFLQLKNDKVVKQDQGPLQTKDIADCIAEVVDALIGDTLAGHRGELADRRMEPGAERGYSIGGHRGRNAFSEFYSEKGSRGGQLDPARGIDPRRRSRGD